MQPNLANIFFYLRVCYPNIITAKAYVIRDLKLLLVDTTMLPELVAVPTPDVIAIEPSMVTATPHVLHCCPAHHRCHHCCHLHCFCELHRCS